MNCRNCGTELPAGALFCGECGTTVAVPRLVEPHTRPRPGDTAIIPPLDLRAPELAFLEPEPGERPAVVERPIAPEPWPPGVHAASRPEPAAPATEPLLPAPESPAPPIPEPPAAAPLVPVPPSPARPTVAPPAALPLIPAASTPAPSVAPESRAAPAAPAATRRPASAVPSEFPLIDAGFESQHDDVEATRIVRARQGDRFVLQFSTGENATVFGTGLIGRNPSLQPGEFVDQLVTIIDQGKSVSKTHLEFGQTAGTFWVLDRSSANGTIVRQPDARPQRLEAGRRQPVARGTRVDIGEQFFVVS